MPASLGIPGRPVELGRRELPLGPCGGRGPLVASGPNALRAWVLLWGGFHKPRQGRPRLQGFRAARGRKS